MGRLGQVKAWLLDAPIGGCFHVFMAEEAR